MRSRRGTALVGTLTARIALAFRPDPWWRCLLARCLFDRNHHERAEALLRSGLKDDPESLELNFELGRQLNHLERLEEAREIFDRLARLHLASPWPALGLAAIEVTEWRFDLALQHCQRAEALIPDASSPNEWLDLAGSLIWIPGQRQRALAPLSRAAESRDAHWLVHLLLALLLEEQDGSSAADHLRRAKRLWRGRSRAFDAKVSEYRMLLQNYGG